VKNLNIDFTCPTQVEKLIQRGPDTAAIEDRLPMTPRAKSVIMFAMEEAQRFKHEYVGTEHILSGCSASRRVSPLNLDESRPEIRRGPSRSPGILRHGEPERGAAASDPEPVTTSPMISAQHGTRHGRDAAAPSK